MTPSWNRLATAWLWTLGLTFSLLGCQPELGGWTRRAGPTAGELGESSEPWLQAVRVASPTEVWGLSAMGNVARWDGGRWRLECSVGYPGSDLALVAGVPWAAGDDALLRCGASGAEQGAAPPRATRQWFTRLWGLRPDDVWVQWQGSESQAGVFRWNGQRWESRAEPYIPQWGAAPDDAWAVHGGSLFHWDGASWREHPATGVRAVWGRASDEVWAVGRFETLLRWDGATWSELSGRGPCDYHVCATFNGVWGTSPSDLWVVGENGPGFGGSAFGAIQHWDGKSLTPVLKYAATPRQWNEANDLGPVRHVSGFHTGEAFATDGRVLLHLAR